MKIFETTITPKQAERLLRKNKHNRPLNISHVKLLADEMSSGRWKLNGDTIRMNGELLIDGQHRLHACVKSNTPFRTLMIEGLNFEVFDTIDTGKNRSAADTLALRGEKNTRSLAASVVFVDQYFKSNLKSRSKYSNTKIEELLNNSYPDIRNSVQFAKRSNLRRLVPESLFIGLHYLFSKSDEHLANLFMESFLRGQGITDEDPVYLLRERMLQNTLSKSKLKKEYIAAIFIKAWNATKSGKKIKYLRWIEEGKSQEQFPVIS